MSILYAYKLCFLLALLNSASPGIVGNVAPPSAGFSLPIVSNHNTAGRLGHPDANLTGIGPHIAPAGWPLYGVLVGVGSGQTRHFYKLGLDLVGNLTWMQCQPCVPEVRQEGPVFDSAVSPRYKHMKPTDHRCTPPYTPSGGERCSFYTTSWNVAAHGYLGRDTFAFAGSPGSGAGGHNRDVDNLVFGCAHTTDGFESLSHGVLAGSLSLNRHPTSFLSQLTARGLADLRFSYCLFPGQSHPSARHGFLRFGRDIPRHGHAQSTSLIFTGSGSGQASMYYIRVIGISLNGKNLKGLKTVMFARDPQTHRGGSVVDPGTPLTRLVRAAYDIVEAEVAANMQKQGARRAPVPGHRLCFGSWGHAHPPSLTIKLFEAKIFIKPELLFVRVTNEHLCFAVVPDEEMTVLGAAQQVDTRFTFDLRANRLYFAAEHCNADTAATI